MRFNARLMMVKVLTGAILNEDQLMLLIAPFVSQYFKRELIHVKEENLQIAKKDL